MKHRPALSVARSPSYSLLASEPLRGFVDYVSSYLPAPATPRGDGHSVIVYPGLGAGPWSTVRLRQQLIAAGFDAVDWGFGQNHGPRGDVSTWLAELVGAVQVARDRHDRQVSLVGWSLGGIYAREIARAAPQLVRKVITLGSPISAKPSETHAGWLYALLSKSKVDPADIDRMKRPLPVPAVSIYSKSDGVVPWQGCLQQRAQGARNIEVPGVSHLGMGTNRKVVQLVAQELARSRDRAHSGA